MWKIKSFIYFTIIALLAPTGCKKDCPKCQDPTNPDCENYDPCYNFTPSANFTIRPNPGGQLPRPEDLRVPPCDTIYSSGANFSALQSGALSYVWKIGDDARAFTGWQLLLDFSDYINDVDKNWYPKPASYPVQFSKPIDVELTITNKLGECVSEDQRVLSEKRTLTFASNNLIFGKFRGKDGEGNSHDIEIYSYYYPQDPQGWTTRTNYIGLPNLDNKDTLSVYTGFEPFSLITFKHWQWDTETTEPVELKRLGRTEYPLDGLNRFISTVHHRSSLKDIIEIEYTYVKDKNNYKKYTFRGERVL